MGSSQASDRTFLVVRREGAQPRFDLVAIAGELARLRTDAAALRVLFDWSQIRSWPFAAPSAAAIQEWNKTAPAIARAAFVHDPKWNRHAAILSALLRVSNAEARSFHRSDTDRAIAWLERAAGEIDVR
jgi:hypothetical protein